MTKILDGKKVGESIRNHAASEAKALREKGIIPKLAILRVGEEESSISYEASAVKVMKECGIETEQITLNEKVDSEAVLQKIRSLNEEKTVHGIILMHPLPSHLAKSKISEAINPLKDVDGLHPINLGRLVEGDLNGLTPSTPQAVIEILKYYETELEGADVVVIGSSSTVGKPLSIMLTNLKATVSNLHIYSKNLEKYTKNADILISATGHLGLVSNNHIKEGSVIIDVGYGYKEGKPMGDVNFSDVYPKVSAITPVPGGVGAVTTSVLASQVIKAAKALNIVDE